ncbi:MAG: hypothetical protein WC876_10580 [Candidatus Thermoplasmatota archaeon]|jgi:spermidine/putrescine-binding protein
MVATDTVVGIVGAALLVAVMAGVFVYEYNNPAEAEDTSDAGLRAHFEEDYAGMSAGDDIDGDGTANYMDADLDGDDVNNENDTAVATTTSMSDALGPQVGGTVVPSLVLEFYVGNGSVHIMTTVTTSAQVSNPLFSGNFVMELLRPDGSIADTAASAPGGPNTFTLETQMEDEVPTGDWMVRVTQNQAGAGGNIDIASEVHYPMPMAEGHGHIPERE